MSEDRVGNRGTSRPWLIAYALVWLLPAIGLALRILYGTLQGDLFEHAAAVRALAADPFQPGNPILSVDAPHTLYSPYSLFLALVVRVTALDPFVVLSFAGFVNVVVLAVGFRAVVRLFTRSESALVLAAVFAILLWGSQSLPFGHDPWIWSGFLNLTSLSYGLPYPSSFAVGLAFIALAIAARALERPGVRDLVVLAVIQASVVIMHPYTAVFLAIAVVALVIARAERSIVRRAFAILAALAIGTGASLAWPYYPVAQLVTGQAAAFDWEQQEMYAFVVRRIYPVLVGLAFIVHRATRNRRDPLVLLFLGLAIVYGFGYASGRFTLGRELPFLVLTLDIALAAGLTELWRQRGRWQAPLGRVGPLAGYASAVVVAAIVIGVSALGIRTDLATGTGHAAVQEMAQRTGRTDVVLADPSSSFEVPAWGGKVVGWNGAVGFIPDIAQRRSDVAAFFDPATSEADRQAILGRYHVQWILFDRGSRGMTADLEVAIDRLGSAAGVSSDGSVILIRVAS